MTLEVTPDQALNLVQATAGGSNELRLLLRPPVKTVPLSFPPGTPLDAMLERQFSGSL